MRETEPGGHGSATELDSEALVLLGRAIASLRGDTDYITAAITDFIEGLGPVEVGAMSQEQMNWLIESGAMTEHRLERALAAVERGDLKVSQVRTFLSFLADSITLEQAAGLLSISADAVRQAVKDRTLYAFEVHGRLRFPQWQFDLREPDHRLRGLTEIIRSIPEDEHWVSIHAQMTTPLDDLSTMGRHTAVEWLRNGGDVTRVTRILSSEYLG